VDRGRGDAVRAREVEQRVGDVGRAVELPGEGVARGERRRAPSFLVIEPGSLRALDDLLEASARVGTAAARVLVADARAEGADRARLVVDGVLHGTHRRVALAGARVETHPRLVEQLGTRELRLGIFR